MTQSQTPRPAVRRALLLVSLLLVSAAGTLSAQTPTVNGLFHGDGDNTRYQPYATSVGGSVLYSYFDAPSQRLYVALVVSHAVNDLVCSPKANSAYTSSATPPWGGHRSCKRASDLEFASFTLQCAPGDLQRSWSWQQALGCAQNLANPPSNWVSNLTCGPSTGIWPPSIVATTSWVQNVNTYQTAATARGWNLYAFGTDLEDGWKSPFLTSAPNNVTVVPGYPTYSGSNFQWEWSMVYEWSVNLGPGTAQNPGTNCGNNPIFFVSGVSHHSPPKSGAENDPFNTPPGGGFLDDWGDNPASYGTLSAANGPRHRITVSGPYLGQQLQSETNGVPTADSSGDGPEEDGVTANVTSNWTPGSAQSFNVTVARATVGTVLGAWFDWNNDGDFADPGEFVSIPVVNGVNTLPVVVGAAFNWQTQPLYTRFRIFSSALAAPGGSLDQVDFAGQATDGEVEDHRFQIGSLPVTLNAFTTEGRAGGEVTVRWQTASETANVAFEVWGLVGGTWQALTDMIPTASMNSGLPQSYETRISAPQGLTALQLVDYDTQGRSERFGGFRLGQTYGEFQPVRRIDWAGPRRERAERLHARGFENTASGSPLRAERAAGDLPAAARWKKLHSGPPVDGLAAERHAGSGIGVATAAGKKGGNPTSTAGISTGPSTHVAVTKAGIQRVTYEDLRAGGLDLAGVKSGDIAVTWRGAPVARWIDGSSSFGPGSAIEFLGRPPTGDDALYLDANLFQVSVDPVSARKTATLGQAKAKNVSDWYLREVWSDRPLTYNQMSPTGDPWLERTVFARRTATTTLDLSIDGPVVELPGKLVVVLGPMTDLEDRRNASGGVIPENNVEVWFRGPTTDFIHLTDSSISGQKAWRIEAPIPSGWVGTGLHQIQLRFSTEYPFSFVAVDRYGIGYRSPYRGPSLDFVPDPAAGGYLIEGFTGPSVGVYAEAAGGLLTRVEPRVVASATGSAIEVRPVVAERLWVTEAPHRPAVFTTEAPGDLLADPADLVVIAESSFLGTPALDDYLAQKAAFDPIVVDVEDIYNAVGFGMALPSAITDYLALRDATHPFSHVQLVGTDCYDRLNYISSCVSFIPLPTAPVEVSRFSPSQNRLVDLDGDGVGDKAVGQFSVRDAGELATIVAKGAAWTSSGLDAADSVLLIAEETDGLHSFSSQIERLEGRLGWAERDVLNLADHPSISTARTAMRASLEAGRSLTLFSGHSSPTVWSFRSLLTSGTAAALTNHGKPTLMVPLACETTYDISPNANLLGHHLLFAGDRGAVAITGAVALSALAANERMANHVLDGLDAGLTLGEAVQAGRQALGAADQELLDNWHLQGDSAIRLER